MPERVTVSIVAEDSAELHQIAGALEKLGMHVQSVLAETGVLIVQTTRDELAALDGVAGIAAWEIERTVRIAPPGSPIQ